MGRRVLVIMTCENVLPVLFPVLTEVKGTDGADVEAVFNQILSYTQSCHNPHAVDG